jgi:outer membrane biosynthesis protein TonB
MLGGARTSTPWAGDGWDSRYPPSPSAQRGKHDDAVNIRTIHVALFLSVLLHSAALWTWLPQIRVTLPQSERLDERAPLELRLQPPAAPMPAKPAEPSLPRPRSEPSPPVAPARPKRPEPPPVPAPAPPARMTRKAAPSEPLAYSVPEPMPPRVPSPTPSPAPVPTPPSIPAPGSTPQAAPDMDLSSYIESRRRARQQSASPPAPSAPAAVEESETARANRIAAANLGLGSKPSFGEDRTGGGVFQLRRVSFDSAEYLFYGWNADIRRDTTQVITVRRGLQPDIRRAVVRSMMEIIRRHEQGDFLWESRRLGRNVSLSARPADDAGLEDFLMKEFFDEERGPPPSRLQ